MKLRCFASDNDLRSPPGRISQAPGHDQPHPRPLNGLQFGRGEKKFGRGEHILSISTSVGVKRIRLAYAETSLGVNFF